MVAVVRHAEPARALPSLAGGGRPEATSWIAVAIELAKRPKWAIEGFDRAERWRAVLCVTENRVAGVGAQRTARPTLRFD